MEDPPTMGVFFKPFWVVREKRGWNKGGEKEEEPRRKMGGKKKV
jgi:hypothetical protein